MACGNEMEYDYTAGKYWCPFCGEYEEDILKELGL
jgi:predicted RNA-binding Zn-ribbon protein involved in translation (DUF1610 family)